MNVVSTMKKKSKLIIQEWKKVNLLNHGNLLSTHMYTHYQLHDKNRQKITVNINIHTKSQNQGLFSHGSPVIIVLPS